MAKRAVYVGIPFRTLRQWLYGETEKYLQLPGQSRTMWKLSYSARIPETCIFQ